ncbi:MAG: vWA domain-containing protein, partial [Planctomycetaceae bacterium]
MIFQHRRSSSFLFSVGIQVAVILCLAVLTRPLVLGDTQAILETIMQPEERDREEFEKELDDSKTIAETMNITAGSVQSTIVGGSDAPLAQQTKVELEQVVREPDVQIKLVDATLPGLDRLGEDLGEAEVTGEVGALVEGYGAALDRLTQELLRLMRTEKVLAVWMFDESESMKDDQEELKGRLHRVYEELKLVEADAAKLNRRSSTRASGDDVLLTAVTSFGASFHVHTPKPTSDSRQIMQAIDRIPIDRTGKENMCLAIQAAMKKYGKMARGRKVALIVVSDESGDDGDPYIAPAADQIENALAALKSHRSPIYILGRESVFGNFYAYVRWRHPQTGHVHKLPIRRGPEAPSAEQLLYDGFRRRFDSHMSGFGPYEQVRLARDSGGIFFQLPHEEENLNDFKQKQFASLRLREYLPNLDSRRVYIGDVSKSKFRVAIRTAIALLNPLNPQNKGLEIPEIEHFVVDPVQSTTRVLARLQQISRVLQVMATAHQNLAAVRSLRDAEPSLRWRANYDLMSAQLMAYRVRLFEYGIALGQFGKNMPRLIPAKNPPHNRWEIRHGSNKLLMPDAQQEKALGVTAEQLRSYHREALQQLASVRETHQGTPWAMRAQWEEGRRFGATFRSW